MLQKRGSMILKELCHDKSDGPKKKTQAAATLQSSTQWL